MLSLVNRPNWGDKDRFRTLLRQHAQNLSNSVSYSGHMYAMKSAAGPLTSTASLSECWEGRVKLTYDFSGYYWN